MSTVRDIKLVAVAATIGWIAALAVVTSVALNRGGESILQEQRLTTDPSPIIRHCILEGEPPYQLLANVPHNLVAVEVFADPVRSYFLGCRLVEEGGE